MNIRVPTIGATEPNFWKDLKAWCGSVARKLNQNEKRIDAISHKPPKPHPHQLLKTFDPDVTSDTVSWKCRTGFVYIGETAYEHTGHVAGNYYDAVTDDDGRLDDPDTYPVVSVYAMIDLDTGDWAYDTDPTKLVYAGRTAIEIAVKTGVVIRQKQYSHILISAADFSEMFTVREDGDDVLIRPGLWLRDGQPSGTRVTVGETWDTDPLDAKTLAGVAANYTGNIYVYAVLKYSTGRQDTWGPVDLSPTSGDWENNVAFGNGLEFAFVDDAIGSARMSTEWLPIAEIIYDGGNIDGITQLHSGPRIDSDPYNITVGTASDFSIEIQYDYVTPFGLRLLVRGGDWYSPRSGTSLSVSSETFTYADLVSGSDQIWATIYPDDSGAATESPDPALVPSSGRIVLNDSSYSPATWESKNGDGQRLLGDYVVQKIGTKNYETFKYERGHIGRIVAYYERPDGKDSNLAALGSPRGFSLDYVTALQSADHEGETQLLKWLDATYVETGPTSLSTFDDDYAVLVRDKTGSDHILRYVPLDAVTVPIGDVTPGDMDPSSDWDDWIDDQLHDHGEHEAASLTHAADHGWAWANGSQADGSTNDYTRNYGSSIGKDASTLVIDLANLELESGPWSVTDTTAAADDFSGAFMVEGGITAKKGIFSEKGAGNWAGAFGDLSNAVVLCSGSAAVNITAGDYYHLSTKGETVSGWVSGGIVVGTDVSEYSIRAIPAGGGDPIEIKVLGRPV